MLTTSTTRTRRRNVARRRQSTAATRAASPAHNRRRLAADNERSTNTLDAARRTRRDAKQINRRAGARRAFGLRRADDEPSVATSPTPSTRLQAIETRHGPQQIGVVVDVARRRVRSGVDDRRARLSQAQTSIGVATRAIAGGAPDCSWARRRRTSTGRRCAASASCAVSAVAASTTHGAHLVRGRGDKVEHGAQCGARRASLRAVHCRCACASCSSQQMHRRRWSVAFASERADGGDDLVLARRHGRGGDVKRHQFGLRDVAAASMSSVQRAAAAPRRAPRRWRRARRRRAPAHRARSRGAAARQTRRAARDIAARRR